MNRLTDAFELEVAIHDNLRSREKQLEPFEGKSTIYLHHRAYIIQWLHNIANHYSLERTTRAAAISYLDRFSELVNIPISGLYI